LYSFLTDSWSDIEKHYPSDSWNDVGTNLYGCLKQLYLLKKTNRKLKILLSIGGWTYSSNFAGPASTEAGRSRFAQTAVQLVQDYGFDGLDIDWEYPADERQASHYVLLLEACRKALNSYASSTGASESSFYLTVACPAGPQNYQKLKLAEMDKYLDFWNLMAYDYAGGWDSTAGHQANLYRSTSSPSHTPFATDDAVKYYISNGVAAAKIVVGMPLYGRAFQNTDGLGSSFSGTGEGSWEQGVWDYKALPREGAKEGYDKELGATWSYDKEKKLLISYDTVALAREKARYVLDKGLGGAMWWEASGDKKGQDSLISAVVSTFEPEKLDSKQNVLDYPKSKYENLKSGMSS
jgi:chitinase